METLGPWTVGYRGYAPEEERLREALCTLGNGYVATRAAFPGSVADGVHYPGTYVAGCYDRAATDIAGRSIVNESIVNLPDWLHVRIAIDDGDWFDLDRASLLEYELRVELRHGLLVRRLRFRDAEGRSTGLVERRLVHMRHEHLAAMELTVVAADWSGRLRIRSGIDGRVENAGVARYAELASDHLVPVGTDEVDDDTILLRAETRTSSIRVAEAARHRLRRGDGRLDIDPELVREEAFVAHEFDVDVAEGEAVTLEKTVSIHTSRDVATFEPGHEARVELGAAVGSFAELAESHAVAWVGLWDRFRTELETDDDTERVLRLHLFHLLQTVSPNTGPYDVGVPPRGLHGEAYRGLIMWDEIFVLPILNLRLPSLTRSLLAYRYHRLPAARRAALDAGHEGAMFPWQSAMDGEEMAQEVHLNPVSGRWVPDATHLQRHIGLAVAYNVWQYHQTTGDDAFLAEQGAEILLEVARFFASLATYEPGPARYAIRGIVGPDEFHTSYPDAEGPGVDNNAYTNVMAAWLFRRVVELPGLLADHRWDELCDQLGVSRRDVERWDELSRSLVVPFHGGVISQYEGYEQLEELDWDGLRRRHGDIHRLDRILEAEGDTPDRYKASKQADVLMLFYLFSADELRDQFEHMGYELAPETVTDTIDYYLERTSHGSTLSAVVHGWVLARSQRERALTFLRRALVSDVNDVQGGTTEEGVHLGAMAGSVDLLLRCFTGLEIRDGTLHVNPFWPEELGVLEFDILVRGHPLTLRTSGASVRVTSAPGRRPPLTVTSPTRTVELRPGQSVELR
ncbi:MAG: glycoside hydrolase family 65 protein [Actinobacteria bacterium]|nr:glycoside hydrolase family 65 protein [Actinomycetota bacterium]